jgi:hypothetical protein
LSRVLSARAMTNPRVARWLAQTVNISSHKAAQESVRKLSLIIAREPAVAQELKPIYQFLEGRLERPLAADPKQSGVATMNSATLFENKLAVPDPQPKSAEVATMIVDSVQKRAGSLRTTNRTHRISRPLADRHSRECKRTGGRGQCLRCISCPSGLRSTVLANLCTRLASTTSRWLGRTRLPRPLPMLP